MRQVLLHWATVGRASRQLRGFYMTQDEFANRIGISQKLSSHTGTWRKGEVLLSFSHQ